jgi:hypothetical protein
VDARVKPRFWPSLTIGLMQCRSRVCSRVAGAFDPFEDGGEVALQSHLVFAARLAGRDDDAVDDLADGVGGLESVVRMLQASVSRSTLPVGPGDVRMDVGNVLRPIRHAGGETILFGFKLGQPVGQGAMPTALLDDAHDLGDGFIRLGKLGRRIRLSFGAGG